MSFRNLINKGKAHATKFFGSTLPTSVREGVRFMNTHLVPAYQKAHAIHGVVAKELRTNEHVPVKLKAVERKSSAFADLGLTHLGRAQTSINRVAGQLDLA